MKNTFLTLNNYVYFSNILFYVFYKYKLIFLNYILIMKL